MATSRTPSKAPTVQQIFRELKQLGKPNTAKIYARHGVREPSVGLPFADLERLVKRFGAQPTLVGDLWKSGLHDARMLALRVADPAQVKKKDLDAWLSQASNYIITAAIASLTAKRDDALHVAQRWIESDAEWRCSAGWSVLSELAARGDVDDALAKDLLRRIAAEIHDAPNRARYSMNNALIAIGGTLPKVRARALAVAKSIGKVHVDHGETGCKTPDAGPYILRMVDHAARRANTSSSKSTARKVSSR